MVEKYLKYIIVVVVLLAAASAVWAWFNPRTVIQEKFIEVEVPKEIVRIERVEILVEKIVVIEKEAVMKTVFVPEYVRKDEDKQITAVGQVPPHDGKTSVVAVFDTSTGETKLNFRQERPPFFAFTNYRELGIRYGFGTMGREADLYGRWSFVRVGTLHLGIYAELNSNKQAMAMLEVSYRF
jgi:hypothetical protein